MCAQGHGDRGYEYVKRGDGDGCGEESWPSFMVLVADAGHMLTDAGAIEPSRSGRSGSARHRGVTVRPQTRRDPVRAGNGITLLVVAALITVAATGRPAAQS